MAGKVKRLLELSVTLADWLDQAVGRAARPLPQAKLLAREGPSK